MASSLEEIRRYRVKKLEILKKAGMAPYPGKISFAILAAADVKKNFKKYAVSKKTLGVAGRIMARREHGGSMFLDIFDGTSTLQVFLSKDKIGEKSYKLFSEAVDIGDFIAVSGKTFYTKKKEPTIEAAKWEMLSKSLLPLPEKWHGLRDVEERFRKRHLDLLMNQDVRVIFQTRAKIIQAAREFFEKNGYAEVDTPILQPLYGGGLARPFKTNHNALGIPLYLRISDELYLKRLVVGGFTKIYEICKDFRNEGIDRFHNPEFVLLEAMTAYEDYRFSMGLVEEFYKFVVKRINNNLQVRYADNIIDFKKPWDKFTMEDIVRSKTGFDFSAAKTPAEAGGQARGLGIPENKIKEQRSVGEMLNLIFEEKVQPNLIQPTIIYDYPVETSPLAKKNKKDPRFVERFEHFIIGQEHGNHYSELNDPLDLSERFIEEAKKKEAGFEEAHQTDKDFLEAVEQGMPPVTGIGISIDRLTMLLTNTRNIKEVILFPTMKPKM